MCAVGVRFAGVRVTGVGIAGVITKGVRAESFIFAGARAVAAGVVGAAAGEKKGGNADSRSAVCVGEVKSPRRRLPPGPRVDCPGPRVGRAADDAGANDTSGVS